MGASNPYPPRQIWASRSVPTEVVAGTARTTSIFCGGERYPSAHTGSMKRCQERVITANVSLVAADPFLMVWPFEVMILHRRHMVLLQDIVFTSAETGGAAAKRQSQYSFEERPFPSRLLPHLPTNLKGRFARVSPLRLGLNKASADPSPRPRTGLKQHFIKEQIYSFTSGSLNPEVRINGCALKEPGSLSFI